MFGVVSSSLAEEEEEEDDDNDADDKFSAKERNRSRGGRRGVVRILATIVVVGLWIDDRIIVADVVGTITNASTVAVAAVGCQSDTNSTTCKYNNNNKTAPIRARGNDGKTLHLHHHLLDRYPLLLLSIIINLVRTDLR